MQETQHNVNKSLNPFEASRTNLRAPSITIARLTLESYFRSGWMWTEFVLVLVFFAALFFPFQEDVPYFYGTSNWDLSAIAILGAAIMVRQATSARTYVLLARLSSRTGYSRGLMLATAVLRIPLWPISACYQMSASGILSFTGVVEIILIAVYCMCLALIAGYWLERRELLLY
jgi:hypothetical protein